MLKKVLLLIFILISSELQAATVRVEKAADGWRLFADDQPVFVKGVIYTPAKVGEDPGINTMRDWMVVDDDKDGRIDAAYQSWVDKNRNNKRDEDEHEIGDFQLLKDMGANVIRLYHHPSADPAIQAVNPNTTTLHAHPPNKALLRDLHQNYGIWVMAGDLLGAYTIGSGADWYSGTDYTNPKHRANMLKSVEAMVKDFKDEPFLLMYAIGNENNFPDLARTNARDQPEAYAKFVNSVAQRIHELDPHHPVVLVNGGLHMIDVYAKHAPDIDILGINLYQSFPSSIALWQKVSQVYDKPILITEYGNANPIIKNGELDEIRQYQFHLKNWRDIASHAAGKNEPGNALGGFSFEWLDNWWHNGVPERHNTSWDGWNLEWHGIASHGDGSQGPFMRQLRQVYYAYQEIWREN